MSGELVLECFGISIARYYFNKILRPAIVYLRTLAVHLAHFVDDILPYDATGKCKTTVSVGFRCVINTRVDTEHGEVRSYTNM